MKDWTKKTMTRWQREMFERIICGLCHICKAGVQAIPEKGGGYYHWEQNEASVFVCGDEKPCTASVVRQEIEKVYGPLVARSLCRKRG